MAFIEPPKERELRLDFFRGIALIFIFLDHIPSNLMSWITIRNFGPHADSQPCKSDARRAG